MNRKLGCLRATLYAIALVASQCELLAANSTTLSVTLVTNVSATTLVPSVGVTGDRGIYALQYASGMGGGQTNWGTLTNITLSGAMTNWLDYSGAGQAQRFYRTVAEMALIPEGSFQMGNCMGTNEGNTNELPVHTVNVSAFYMDKNLVTKELWDEVYHWATNNGYSFDNAGYGKELTHPVQTVSWYDVVKWCNARSEKAGRVPAYYTSAGQTNVYRTGQIGVQNEWVKWDSGYRLPTEAEWEKAARGGLSGKRFPWGDTISWDQANYLVFPLGHAYDVNPTTGYHSSYTNGVMPYTSPVGSFDVNGYGLYDMAGNVLEWCWDWYGSYGSDSQTDPRGFSSGSNRVMRGGGWASVAVGCRAANRGNDMPGAIGDSVGLRSVLPPSQP